MAIIQHNIFINSLYFHEHFNITPGEEALRSIDVHMHEHAG